MIEADQRAAVIAEAMTWIGTPFHDNAAVKGAGVDCAHYVHECYRRAGVIADLGIEHYSPQHMLHRDQELFLGYVLRVAHEIAIEDLMPADLVLYRVGRVYAHGAIVIDWPGKIIHAHKQSDQVLIMGAFDCNLSRDVKAFSFWGR